MAAITRPGQHGGARAAYGLFDGKVEAAPPEPTRFPAVTGIFRPRIDGRLAGPVTGTYRPEVRA